MKIKIIPKYLDDAENARMLEQFSNWAYEHDPDFRQAVDEAIIRVVSAYLKGIKPPTELP